MRSPIWKNHLENFTNYDFFKKEAESFVTSAVSMRWTIYKNPPNKYWWTSDNPGYCLNLKNYKETGRIKTNPIYDIKGVNSVLFYPLSKEYCLNIHPYYQNDEVTLNAENTEVTFKTADLSFVDFINKATYLTQDRLIISTDLDSLSNLGE